MNDKETADHRRARLAAWSVASALLRPLWFVLCFASACVLERDRPNDGGQHPAGWLEPKSDAFHGRWLSSNGYKLEDCQVCHGDDYKGGPVGVGCATSGCHERGPEQCGTCHGILGGPRPASGAHAAHTTLCSECHAVPAKIRSGGHINGSVEVVFSGLASLKGAAPAWDASARTCSGTYCHVAGSPSWDDPVAAACDSCHGDPPASHARFAAVAPSGSCASCHPAPPDESRHINGALDLRDDLTCVSCHGSASTSLGGAPPPALNGSADPSNRGVGAHRRHLDPTIADRIGRVADCNDCHSVPKAVTSQGHLDSSEPADVVLVGQGGYDAASQRCVVACHWDRSPGPSWTDISGAPRACDACHGFPPTVTREGTAHTLSLPEIGACLQCHSFDPTTHVDNHVDFVQ